MKCELFCNGHCSFHCPNTAIDEWEERFELDAARELGVERVTCKDCQYADKRCTCDDCYFKYSDICPENK